MAPTDEQAPADPTPDQRAPRRRVVFPWAWLGVLGGARLAFELTDFTVDFKTIATMATLGLMLIGVALWYLIRGRGPMPLRIMVGATPFLLFGGCNLLFEPQFNGAGKIVGLHRRGQPKADQQLQSVDQGASVDGLADWGPGDFDYPRFLGTGPWAEAIGPEIATDWSEQPPELLWRRDVGAGWSSFAVYGQYAVTQEQRGDEELVVCYGLMTGEPAWSHADPVRFDPDDFAGQMGRQGPRATPTIVGNRVYTHGAKGLVNCLDARTGEVLWQVDTSAAYGATVPVWGKSGSPLYLDTGDESVPDLVVINVGAPDDVSAPEDAAEYNASVVAFDAQTGEEVWTTGSRQTSYASPALVELHGERVVLQTSDDLFAGYAVSSGKKLFDYPWSGRSADRPSCSQPIDLGENRILLTKGYGHGASLLRVLREGTDWSVEPEWSPAIRPVLQTKFSNPVVRDGHAYALNGETLQCVEVETGKIAWRKRRRPAFGFGQVLLFNGGLLVMCEESGEAVLVATTPDGYQELAAKIVLTEGEVCWNNPVIAGDLLLVRNAVEAAVYRLSLAEPAPAAVAAQ